jgi:hypothetical protein
MLPTAPTHICLCSKCYGRSKRVTKRTIEAHLQQDQLFLQSLSSDTESAHFMRSCINETIQLLSQLHADSRPLDTVSDSDSSHPEGPKGVLHSF